LEGEVDDTRTLARDLLSALAYLATCTLLVAGAAMVGG
jgi:hypothetical protein